MVVVLLVVGSFCLLFKGGEKRKEKQKNVDLLYQRKKHFENNHFLIF